MSRDDDTRGVPSAVPGPGVRGGWPVRLSDVLKPTLERIGPRGLWTEARLRKAWTDAVGEQVAIHAQVRRLRGRTLEVQVSSDAWATELTYLSQAVIAKLNAAMGGDVVDEISVLKMRSSDR